jgi:beta-lactamase superfamily II metal-dependent hydrolase
VYEALPSNILVQLENVRYQQGKVRLDAALERVDLAVRASLESSGHALDPEALEDNVRSATDALPDDGPYAMECRGLRASAMKRLAHAAYLQGMAADRDTHLSRSCDRLEDALTCYRQAGKTFLRNDSAGVQRVATLHWVLVQELSLQAVLLEDINAGIWGAAVLAATSYLDHPNTDERAWAHASLAELWLLRLAMPGVDEAAKNEARQRVREHVDLLNALYPHEDAFPIRSTRKQFNRYLEWWAADPFVQFVESRPHRTPQPWSDRQALLDAAKNAVSRLSAKAKVSAWRTPSRLRPALSAGAETKQTEQSAALLRDSSAAPERRPRTRPQAGAFLEIHMLPAQYGDCLWIEYGVDPRSTARVLIDCGTRRTNSALMARIERLPPNERAVELFVLTHIDDDHIGGAIPFLEAEMGGLDVKEVWFNGYKHLSEVLGAMQGERFSTLIEERELPWNKWREGQAIVLEDRLPQCVLPGGLTLTLLSPTRDKLETLRTRWEKEVVERGFTPGAGLSADDLLGGDPDADSTDVDDMADRVFKSDRAAPNGSSIAFLAEFEGKSALFAADAHPPVLEASIRELLAQRQMDRLPVGALKVSHHASHSNTSVELLKLLDCARYLVSTNGLKFQHPHRVTVSRIIKHGGPRPHLYFNYVSKANEVWARPDLQERYGYRATYPDTAEGLVVKC